jgi:hypothetical protein
MTGAELRAQLRAQQSRNNTPQSAQLTTPSEKGKRNSVAEELRVARVYERNNATEVPTSYWWTLQRPDGTRFDYCSLPEQTADEAVARYPGCIVVADRTSGAGEAPPTDDDAEPAAERHDDRRTCEDCRRLDQEGRCRAADADIRFDWAGRYHRPAKGLLKRCEAFLPRPSDLDQRPGSERWPGLSRTPFAAKTSTSDLN